MIRLKIAATLFALFLAVPAFAADLVGMNLRVFNVKPGTSSYWDINKTVRAPGGGVQFPINKFQSPTTGSFVVYLLANYNIDITGKTITANVSWTPVLEPWPFKTRATDLTNCAGAYVRLEFQDVASGPYDVNDYWWSTGSNSIDLNNTLLNGNGILIASLNDRTLWTNMAGMSATDSTTTDYVDWNGNRMKDTPYNGFSKAMKNVKQIGLSFGNPCSYASGVALDGSTGTFTLKSYKILP